MNRLFKASIIYLSYFILTSVAHAGDKTSFQKFLYIGGEAGLVEPVQRKFQHKESKTDLTLKKSAMYSGKIGYSFYPNMAIEFSATYHPRYRLAYVLPEKDMGNGHPIPKTPGQTKVVSNIYMVNLIYDLKSLNGFTPFVIMGAGLAQVKVKSASSSWSSMEFFKVNTTKTNCFAWQAGIGISKNITENFSLDVTAKLQAIHNIKAKYDTFDLPSAKFVPASPIKKTIGVGEFGIGFTYKLFN